MPTLSAAYPVPQRGNNDDFNNTFVVTTTGAAGAYTASDAWGTYSGTFYLAPTKHESIFMRQYASANDRVYWIPGFDSNPNTALARFVAVRYAYTGPQIIQGGSTTPASSGTTIWGMPNFAWQSYGNNSNSTTCWGLAPNKIRNAIAMGFGVSNIGPNGTYIVVAQPGTTLSTNPDFAAAYNAYILAIRGSYPTTGNDPIFTTDVYMWAMTTTPLIACNETQALTLGQCSTYIGPYIDAIKRKWGPSAGV